ncbi:hypothetical protein ADL03_24850 [Nocardia sp. NRRL S-836]|nr:hypothetical protein ADL03_24850 [Nocardia sp. NRRL S-836]
MAPIVATIGATRSLRDTCRLRLGTHFTACRAYDSASLVSGGARFVFRTEGILPMPDRPTRSQRMWFWIITCTIYAVLVQRQPVTDATVLVVSRAIIGRGRACANTR